MTAIELVQSFHKEFDAVGVIKSSRYVDAAIRMGKEVTAIPYPTLVVLGLAYPKRSISHTETHLVPSFYTFGEDYHKVLHQRIDKVMKALDLSYEAGVDSHCFDERLGAVLAGIGFFGKNQLIINDTFGSYMFLAMVWIDLEISDEIILEVTNDCGTCHRCIDACPGHALAENGYDISKCLSHTNQSKRVLSDDEMDANHVLFGCDICQTVCPKNIGIKKVMHPEFELTGKEMVSIIDLFTLSNTAFQKRYEGMSFLWRGKTVLMRNALSLLNKRPEHPYVEMILDSRLKTGAGWYKDMVGKVIARMKKTNKPEL